MSQAVRIRDSYYGEHHIKEPGLDNRHRDKNGEISRKHGNTPVCTLRKIYGSGFATDFPGTAKLNDVLHKLGEPSLNQLPFGRL
jgi:hypothetical protein